MKKNILYSLAGMPKYAAGFVFTLVARLATPFLGLPNVSPLMATQLTGSKAYGPWVAGLYGGLNMLIIDLVMGQVGTWTLVTALTYGAVGIWGAYFLAKRKASAFNFALASILGTLFFDLITGVFMSSILFGQAWMISAVGQVPFTLRHLAGNLFFAVALAPWFYRKVMTNPSWSFGRFLDPVKERAEA